MPRVGVIFPHVLMTEHELTIAEWVGKMRRKYASAQHFDPGVGGPSANREDFSGEIRGVLAEWACSILLNLYWRPYIGEIRGHDIGGLIDVRSIQYPNGDLAIKPRNRDGPHALILVYNRLECEFRGWMMGNEIKQKYPAMPRKGTDVLHWVPQADLRPIQSLERWVASTMGFGLRPVAVATDTLHQSG